MTQENKDPKEKSEQPFTEEDFIEALKKASQPLPKEQGEDEENNEDE
jgi:hypothetical protein